MDHNLKILITELKKTDYHSFLTQTFAKKEHFANFCALFLLKATLNNIKNVTSEEISSAIRFKWWQENIENIAKNKLEKNHHILNQLKEIHSSNPKITQKLAILCQNWQKDAQKYLNFNNLADLENYINQTYGQFFEICLILTKNQTNLAQNLAFLDFFNNFFIQINQNNENYAKYLTKDLFETLKIPKKNWNKQNAEENLSKICQFLAQKCQYHHPKGRFYLGSFSSLVKAPSTNSTLEKNLKKIITLNKIIIQKLKSQNYNIKLTNLNLSLLDKLKLLIL